MRFPRVKREDIPRILRGGRREAGKYVTLHLDPEGAGDAIIVSKKVARTAVARNRIRRILRGVLRKDGPQKGAWVVMVRQGALQAPLPSLRKEVQVLRARLSHS